MGSLAGSGISNLRSVIIEPFLGGGYMEMPFVEAEEMELPLVEAGDLEIPLVRAGV